MSKSTVMTNETQKPKTKRSYQTPKLKKLGTVKSLTRAGGSTNIDGFNGRNT